MSLTCPILNLIVLRPSDFALKMRTLLWLPKREPAIAWDTNFQCRPQGSVGFQYGDRSRGTRTGEIIKQSHLFHFYFNLTFE